MEYCHTVCATVSSTSLRLQMQSRLAILEHPRQTLHSIFPYARRQQMAVTRDQPPRKARVELLRCLHKVSHHASCTTSNSIVVIRTKTALPVRTRVLSLALSIFHKDHVDVCCFHISLLIFSYCHSTEDFKTYRKLLIRSHTLRNPTMPWSTEITIASLGLLAALIPVLLKLATMSWSAFRSSIPTRAPAREGM